MTTSSPRAHCTVPPSSQHEAVLHPQALEVLGRLHRQFGERLASALSAPAAQAGAVDDSVWTAAPLPPPLRDRRVELVLSAHQRRLGQILSAATATTVRLDWSATMTPDWAGILGAQHELQKSLQALVAAGGSLRLHLIPRAWWQTEPHFTIDGQAVSAGLLDICLHLANNHQALRELGGGAYLGLAGFASVEAAQLWSEILEQLRLEFGLTRDELRCTVVVDSVAALRGLDQSLGALRETVAAAVLNRPAYLLSLASGAVDAGPPPRHELAYDHPLLDAAAKKLCVHCHQRGVLALAPTSALMPVSDDEQAHTEIVATLKDEASYMARIGFDGSAVTQQELVAPVAAVFDEMMPTPNQCERPLDWAVTDADLLPAANQDIDECGLRQNISIALQFIEARLNGWGRVPLYNQMEDVATAGLCCYQLWHWIAQPEAHLIDGRLIDADLFESLLRDELEIITVEIGDEKRAAGRYEHASAILQEIALADAFCADLAGFIASHGQ